MNDNKRGMQKAKQNKRRPSKYSTNTNKHMHFYFDLYLTTILATCNNAISNMCSNKVSSYSIESGLLGDQIFKRNQEQG